MADQPRADASDERLRANRDNWDDRVPIHAASAFYDVEGWLAGGPGPRAREVDALGDVTGLDLVHLQCHFGLDTLAWARAGAQVTGLDFSPAAITKARELAGRAGLAATFVEGNVLDAASVLGGKAFDVVYVSLGALCWLPSVDRWASQVQALLRPGGRLYLHDTHPLCWSFADDGESLAYTYFEEEAPYADDDAATYTDGDAVIAHPRTYQWNHSLGEIVTMLIEHKLRIQRLEEHPWTVHQAFPWMTRGDLDHWVIPADRVQVPLSFTLLAQRGI